MRVMPAEPLFTLPSPDPDPVVAASPVGSVIDTDLGKWGLATATFDASRTYRFRLSRVWNPSLPRINFCMLNPSTADAFKLDPTVRRCVGFAKAWGGGALEVTNAFALRSTDPAGLRHTSDPVGFGNDDAILAAAVAAEVVVLAWGVHATLLDREQHVRRLLAEAGVSAQVLSLTKDGHPAHPLYLPASSQPFSWPL